MGFSVATEDQFQQLMKLRANKLQDICNRTLEFKRRFNFRSIYVLQKKSLVWCPIFKSVSTNWMHNLLYLAGKNEFEVEQIMEEHPKQPNEQARVVAPVVDGATIKQIAYSNISTNLIIVRHPFDRLVSAFRDKLERCSNSSCNLKNHWFYQNHGVHMVRKFRKQAISRFGPDFFSAKHNFGSPGPMIENYRVQELPSWWEFVQHLLHTPSDKFDPHWRPFTMFCSVCFLPYNYILHFENIEAEEKLMAHELQASKILRPRWENKDKDGDEMSRKELLYKYFNMLDEDDILDLYKIYQNDFKMFGYRFKFRGLKLNF